ncbi:hypothetical protein AGR1B_pAt30474 [Agrobacterium fabacearum S56]|nr:hypothetical protein AGR1B_pAt30474 [Agrobacterium fabacearum S56]
MVAPRYHRSLGLQSVFIVSPPLRYVGLFAHNKTGISISLNQSREGGQPAAAFVASALSHRAAVRNCPIRVRPYPSICLPVR